MPKNDDPPQRELIHESEEEFLERLKKDSGIAALFGVPDFGNGKDLVDTIYGRISDAMPLLESAILTAKVGRDSCLHCYNIGELLEAYKTIVRLTFNAAEGEQMRRKKGKAA